jgi:imidazolonepropionase-like amidohydrolase
VEGIDGAVSAGVHMVEHCSWETADGLRLDTAVAERMAEAGTFAGDTITGQTTRYAKGRLPLEALPATLAERFRIFGRMRAVGVRIVTSSDAMYPVTPFEDFPWAIVASHEYGGLTPEAAVQAATGLAATALDLDAEIGTLEAGKRGDILVVSGDVATDIRALTRTSVVLRDGIVVASNGAVSEQGVY